MCTTSFRQICGKCRFSKRSDKLDLSRVALYSMVTPHWIILIGY